MRAREATRPVGFLVCGIPNETASLEPNSSPPLVINEARSDPSNAAPPEETFTQAMGQVTSGHWIVSRENTNACAQGAKNIVYSEDVFYGFSSLAFVIAVTHDSHDTSFGEPADKKSRDAQTTPKSLPQWIVFM